MNEDTVLLAEGVFLFRPELRPWLHAKIFLRADFETILKRVRVRDCQTLGSAAKILERYEKKYIPGQKLYFLEIRPEMFADVIVDNNDFESPEIVFVRSPVAPWPSQHK